MPTSYRNSETAPPIMAGSPPPPEWRVPRDAWDRAPWNRWTFQRVSEILPTARIRHALTSSPLPDASGRLDDVPFETPEGRRTTFGEMLDDTYTDAMLVWKDGRILHESYHNGMDARSVHLLQSVSKSIVATAAASLIDEGHLDPAAPITEALPELQATAWKGATLQQVLDMTTGVRFDESYEQVDGDAGKLDVAAGWKLPPDGIDTSGWPKSTWDQILTLTVAEAAHGARFAYRSIETDVLGHAVERVTGRKLADVVSDRLWQPLGCVEDANIILDPAGYGTASGGISASLRDMARFGLALLNDGLVDGRRVIPKAWIEDTRHGAHGLFNDTGRATLPNGSYRNQFWIEDSTLGRFMGRGVFGQLLYVMPDKGLVAVKLSTWPEFVSVNRLRRTLAALHAVAEL